MNHPAENNGLLQDVLAEATPEEFRAALLGETLRHARRRRGLRRARQAGAVGAAALVLGWFVVRFAPSRAIPETTTEKIASTASSYELITTLPLPAAALVRTQPLAAGALVASSPDTITVNTTPGLGYRVIGDEELLALAAPRRPMLVRVGPDAQELIFENAGDAKN